MDGMGKVKVYNHTRKVSTVVKFQIEMPHVASVIEVGDETFILLACGLYLEAIHPALER